MGGGELGVLDGVGGVVVAPKGLDLGVEAGVVGTGDGDLVVVAGGLDLGVDEGVELTDSSSSDFSSAVPSEVHV